MTAGSSVPEAARAAAREAFLRGVAERGYMDGGPIDDGLAAAAPILVAAAVAEKRATTARRIEETVNGHRTYSVFSSWDDRTQARCHCGWRGLNRSGWTGPLSPAERVFQDERDHVIAVLRAALASPGEGE